MGGLGFFFKSWVHESAMLLWRQLAMGSWKPEAAADFRGVMATLHNTEFSMESLIRCVQVHIE